MVKVKICGITREDDARAAVEAGADALGFVFYGPSPRYVSPQTAALIARTLPPFVVTVGLFVNQSPEEVNRCMEETGLSVAQLHGDETAPMCGQVNRPVIKAFRVGCGDDLKDMSSYDVSALLLDAQAPGLYGGTGKTMSWELAAEAKKYGRIILAGGLTPRNVARAVQEVEPYGVDVSGGVESAPGIKDHRLMERFIKQAKNASQSQIEG